jgi:hypothetical protein
LHPEAGGQRRWAAFADQLGGVAVVKQGETGIDILEALVPVDAVRAVARRKEMTAA